jgi:hypothetical protein
MLTQNFFNKGKYSVTISRNASYVVLFKSPRDAVSIRSLSAQLTDGAAMIKAYELATNRPNGYLLVDLTQQTKKAYTLRTNILDASVKIES